MTEVKVGQRWLYCACGDDKVSGRWNIIEVTSVVVGTRCAVKVIQLGPKCDWIRLGEFLGGEDIPSEGYTFLEGQDKP